MRYQIYDPLTRQARSGAARASSSAIRFPATSFPRTGSSTRCISITSSSCRPPNNNPTDPRQEPTNNYLVRTYTDPIQSHIYGARLDYNRSNTHRFFGRWSGSHFTEGLDDWTYQSAAIHSEDMKRTTNAGTGQLDLDQERDDGGRHAGQREHVFRGRRAENARDHQDRRMSGCPAYLDDKCAASDAARTGSTRGGSCALPIVNIARVLPAVRQERGGGIRHAEHPVQHERDPRSERPHAAIRHRRAAPFAHRIQPRCEPGHVHRSTTTYTRRYSDTALYTPGNLGLSWAAFMLGIPTTSTINTPIDYATSSPYYSGFLQEAWRATPKLTVNLGLRFEFEQGMTESDDRMITSIRSRVSCRRFADAAVAAYARSPIPEVSVSTFAPNLQGGAIYAGPGRSEPPRMEEHRRCGCRARRWPIR